MAIAVAGVLCFQAGLAGQSIPHEYRLKAAFVYQFPQFVEWPSAVWQDARAVQICVVRPNPFGSELEQLVRGETLRGRPLEVREIGGADGLPGCHLLFISGSSTVTAALLKAAAGRPVLTVGESPAFLDDGGIIALKIVQRRVRFEVNATAAQAAGLRISSQLLGLALAVRGGPS